MQQLPLELAKGGISLAVTLVGLGIGWLVGQRLTYQWNLRQRRREADSATARDLQRLYGDFFAIWKLWNGAARGAGAAAHGDLLRRAAEGEGLLEAVLVQLATERRLSADDRVALGKFRQAYQRLRRAIESGQPLPWSTSEHPEYLAFKRLAVAATLILQRDEAGGRVTPGEAFEALRDITSNRHEEAWTA